MKNTKQYLCGIKAGFPVFFGYIPTAIAYSIIAGGAGLSGTETVLMSVMVFAGASQMMAGGMIASGASFISIIFATFILNFRHLIMSMCISEKLKKEKLPIKLLAAFGVTDESFSVTSTSDDVHSHSVFFLLGVITITYLSWIFGTFIGVVANNILPQIVSDSCSVALYAMFIALLMPNAFKNLRLLILVIFTAVLNSLLQTIFDPSTAMIISTLLCAFLGIWFTDDEKEEV